MRLRQVPSAQPKHSRLPLAMFGIDNIGCDDPIEWLGQDRRPPFGGR